MLIHFLQKSTFVLQKIQKILTFPDSDTRFPDYSWLLSKSSFVLTSGPQNPDYSWPHEPCFRQKIFFKNEKAFFFGKRKSPSTHVSPSGSCLHKSSPLWQMTFLAAAITSSLSHFSRNTSHAFFSHWAWNQGKSRKIIEKRKILLPLGLR